jgi:hypothetical protein
MTMDYQFLEDFKKLSVKCPPESYKPKNMQVFRWVFADMADDRNFKPRYFLAPKSEWKKINAITDNQIKDSKLCDKLALSYFDSEEGAKGKFLF